jgi:predicted nucleotide-binding protein
MSTDLIKVPVEYTIITTSDWTQFEIVDGSWWENLNVECRTGEDTLKSPIVMTNNAIRIDKKPEDKSLVIVYIEGTLNIKKYAGQSNLTYRITKGEIQSTLVMVSANGKKPIPLLNNKSDFWGDDTNPMIYEIPRESYIRDLTKEKVFIIHGHAELQALQLKDYLHSKNVTAFRLKELTHNGKTIFEQIEYAQKNCSYAIAILTPDDVGCEKIALNRYLGDKSAPKEKINRISEIFSERVRENVLFELGLFIGALGKENVCYIKQQGINKMFSDFSGVLYYEFKESIEETYAKIHKDLFQS